MRLTSWTGNSVDLSVEGYEFDSRAPQEPGDWDANWLVVAGRVRDSSQTWSFRDACLTTWDANRLLHLLRHPDASEGEAVEFTETNLELQVTATSPEVVTLTLILRGESAPPGTPDDVRWSNGRAVALSVTRDALRTASEDWATQLASFPER